jgi:hypothetical protein
MATFLGLFFNSWIFCNEEIIIVPCGIVAYGEVGSLCRLQFGINFRSNFPCVIVHRCAVAKRRTLFDDRPVEITELTAVIKQNITQLNNQIRNLQAFVNAQNGGRSHSVDQSQQHNNNVVVGLQSSLAKASQGFAEVLEIRTEVGFLIARRGD